jgi:hypothetical protein
VAWIYYIGETGHVQGFGLGYPVENSSGASL